MENKTIYLYGDGIGSVSYVDHLGTQKTIVNAARVSFGKDTNTELDEKDKKLIAYLIKNKHTSTLEHNSLTVKITVPLYVRSQHMRHRTHHFNEISRRYTSENIRFYLPTQFRTQHKSNRQASNENELINPPVINYMWDEVITSETASEAYKEMCEGILDFYTSMIEAGVCREQARGILPQTTYTEYYCTVDLNNLLKFFELRLGEHSQWEIKKVAEAMLEIAKELWPDVIAAWEESSRQTT